MPMTNNVWRLATTLFTIAALAAILSTFFLPRLSGQPLSKSALCASHLRALAMAVSQYRAQYGVDPSAIANLREAGLVFGDDALCPETNMPYAWQPNSDILAADSELHSDGTRCYLCRDGTVSIDRVVGGAAAGP